MQSIRTRPPASSRYFFRLGGAIFDSFWLRPPIVALAATADQYRFADYEFRKAYIRKHDVWKFAHQHPPTFHIV